MFYPTFMLASPLSKILQSTACTAKLLRNEIFTVAAILTAKDPEIIFSSRGDKLDKYVCYRRIQLARSKAQETKKQMGSKGRMRKY
jgi:hypothetical protein